MSRIAWPGNSRTDSSLADSGSITAILEPNASATISIADLRLSIGIRRCWSTGSTTNCLRGENGSRICLMVGFVLESVFVNHVDKSTTVTVLDQSDAMEAFLSF